VCRQRHWSRLLCITENNKPKYLSEVNKLDLTSIKEPKDYNQTLLDLLSNPSIASKSWVFKHGDPKVAKDVLLGPGSDAGVALAPETKKQLQ
jgi:phosphoribosylformylglycinamidine synthase